MARIVLFILHYIGVNRIFYWLTKNRQRVITFHNVIEDKYFDNALHLGVSHSKSIFDFQLAEIKKNYQFTTEINKRQTAIITFDDGYQNNYFEAVPILDKHNAKAVFFVVADLIDNDNILWIDKVLFWFSYVPIGSYQIGALNFMITTENRLENYQIFYDYVLSNYSQICQLLESLELAYSFSSLSLNISYRKSRFMALSTEQLSTMKLQGHLVACHSKSHSILSKLDSNDLQNEISFCESKIPSVYNCNYFSYPFGTNQEVSSEVKDCIKNSNFNISFMNVWNWQKSSCNYSIDRLSLPNTRKMYLIHAHLSGLYYFLKQYFR
jgi:peptidoglycan/xylan/chitin deacetylase (PgdA/CDA1 family)